MEAILAFYLENTSAFWALSVALILCLYLRPCSAAFQRNSKIPIVGIRSVFEPRVLANYRFFKNAKSIVNGGYARFKGTKYQFMRNDADIIVLPVTYIDELNALPSSIANPTAAHVHNLMGHFTGMNLILQSDLHFRTIQTKLTPNLGSVTKPMENELVEALSNDFPNCDDDWVEFNPYEVLLKLVARLSARVFVGLPLSRHPKWLEISTEFTENIFVTVVIMRLFPKWLHPLLGCCLPSLWKGKSYIKEAKRFLAPEIIRRMESFDKGECKEEEPTLLSWMIESARGSERDPKQLAHLEVVLSLASIHTSQMNAVHVLYDLAAYPEYFEILRAEIREVYHKDQGWQKSSYSRLRKMDSFLRESQRFNPPSVLSYHRLIEQTHTLSDGTPLPKGAHICMPVNAIQNDPEVTSDPEVFNPLRSYNLRQKPGESHLHQFAMTERNILNFGHGKAACPGRFFASLEIKVLLTKLIMEYDFKLLPDQNRPKNLMAHEFIFPNTKAKLMAKRREKRGEAPF